MDAVTLGHRVGRGLVVGVVVALAAGCGGSGGGASACEPVRPERVLAEDEAVEDLSLVLPVATVDADGDGAADEVRAGSGEVTVGDLTLIGDRVSLLTWGDLDGDGRDDLVLDVAGEPYVVDGATTSGRHRVTAAGVHVGQRLRYLWPDDLDGRPGADLVEPDRAAGRTTVWSGAAVLAEGPGGDARQLPPARRLRGLPRALAPLAAGAEPETLLLVPDPPSIRFAARPGVELRFADDAAAPAERVEHVVVFDDTDGERRIGLRIDRRVAVWKVPSATC